MRRDVDEYSRLPTHLVDDNYDRIGYKLLVAGWKCVWMVSSADNDRSDSDSQDIDDDIDGDSDEDALLLQQLQQQDAHTTATAGN